MNLKATVLLFMIVFGGVFAALWLDDYLGKRQTVEAIRDEPTEVTPIKYGPEGAPFDFTEAARRVIPSVVSIDTAYMDRRILGDVQVTGGSGSGVVIEGDGYIVTNAHVVRNPRYRTELRAADIVNVRTSDGHIYEADVIGMDQVSDLAVLKVDTDDLQPAIFGDSNEILVGGWVMAVGNQLGFDNSVSVGVISSKNRWLEAQDLSILIDAIQTDASINKGNSGGALCNAQGEVIGINSIIATTNQAAMGIGFAIPSNHVRRFTSDLIEFGKVRYAILGIVLPVPTISMQELRNRERLETSTGFSDTPSYGLLVKDVTPGFPASKAGMTKNSVIMEIDGRRLYSRMDYIRTMMEKRPKETAEIKFWSKGEISEVTVTLTEQ